MNNRLNFLLVLVVFFAVSCTKAPMVGIISTEQGLQTMLEARGYKCTAIDITSPLDSYDLVWYNRTDTSALTPAEIEAGPAFQTFVNKGGKLVLSMEAVKLSNAWGIENNPVEVNDWYAADYGFGRKVGYHSFRSHPLFDGMHGGAYVWHGHADNHNRVLGYSGTNAPTRQGTKIIATLWEYIYYHPDYKVVWEQSLGKGSILSIGCFLYYDTPNYHTAILERFSANVVNYLTGGKTQSPERLWSYEKAEVVCGTPVEFSKVKSEPTVWNISGDASDHLEYTPAAQEVVIPSRRAMTVCDERSGIKEIWTHPIMSLKNYNITVSVGGELYPLKECSEVSLRANSLRRTYSAANVILTEIITAPVESPSVVAHYQWEGNIDSLIVGFSSNMRYMWPYEANALGSLECGWSENSNLYSITTGDSEFVSLIGSNLPSHLLSESASKNLLQVNASFVVSANGKNACDIVMAAGNEGPSKAFAAYKAALKNPQQVYKSSSEYYQDYLNQTVSIVTPDPVFNEGYRWATVSAGQFLVETPGLGTCLMAGYASSLRGWGGGQRVSGRPGYAWYFGRDSEIAAFAMLSMGDFEAAKATLTMLTDFQGENGTIFHELTTSGSNHFDASDATPLYVMLMAEYLRATGDLAFVRERMPNIYKAMSFCASTDTDGDHLIEIQHVGHGWLEGGDYFTENTEFYLSGIWAKALQDAAYLAEIDNNSDLSKSYMSESEVVKAALNNFWNEKGYYNYGLYANGNYSTSLLALTSFPVWMGVTEPEKALSTMEWFAKDNFTKPWGVRQSGDPRPEDNVGPYDECNIWPLLTGSVSLAEYCVGLSEAGFYHLMGNLKCYQVTHGRVPEVLRGNAYRSGGITAFQCWSETGVTGPAIHGMLGWSCNSLEGTVALKPQLPKDWDSIKVGNLRVGKDIISLSMQSDSVSTQYTLTCSGSPKQCSFGVPAGISTVMVDGNEVCVENGIVKFEIKSETKISINK